MGIAILAPMTAMWNPSDSDFAYHMAYHMQRVNSLSLYCIAYDNHRTDFTERQTRCSVVYDASERVSNRHEFCVSTAECDSFA